MSKPLTYRQLKEALAEIPESALDDSVSVQQGGEIFSVYQTVIASDLQEDFSDVVSPESFVLDCDPVE